MTKRPWVGASGNLGSVFVPTSLPSQGGRSGLASFRIPRLETVERPERIVIELQRLMHISSAGRPAYRVPISLLLFDTDDGFL